jgi:hypothetical protein
VQPQEGAQVFEREAPHIWSRLDAAIEEWAMQYSMGKWRPWKLRSIYDPENGFLEGSFPRLMKILQIESVTIPNPSPLRLLTPEEWQRAFEWRIEANAEICNILCDPDHPTPTRAISKAIKKCDAPGNWALSRLLARQGVLKELSDRARTDD